MMQNTQFLIEGKTFESDASMRVTGQFEVQSVPRPYHVSWDDSENPFTKVNALLAENAGNVLLIDEKLLSLYRTSITASPEQTISVPATETFKTLDGVTTVFDFLYQRGFTKGERMIVVGGGIVQDVGAFTAACYKRGIKWVYFPTTLLSMCDSCIGGKSGVNYKDAKNQMALFSAPSQVVINPQFLKTLPDADLKSGLGEILKLSITGGEDLIATYQQHVTHGKVKDLAGYKALILMALSIKRAIVEVDEFELNYRKSLNYGHTLGHAIEVMSDYAIPHGVAVTIGMMLSNEVSYQRQFLSADTKAKLNLLCRELLDDAVVAKLAAMNVDDLLGLLKKDKKTEGNHISFVVMKQPGDTRFEKLKLDNELQASIEKMLQQSFN
jgi:3-dehydroquinate synthase